MWDFVRFLKCLPFRYVQNVNNICEAGWNFDGSRYGKNGQNRGYIFRNFNFFYSDHKNDFQGGNFLILNTVEESTIVQV